MRKFFMAIAVLFASAAAAENPQEYLRWMQSNLPAVPAWTEWQTRTGELPPDFDKLPRQNLLPNPLRFFDGREVPNTNEGWQQRRSEILQLFERYVTGTFPPKPAIENVETLEVIAGDGYTLRNLRVAFTKGSVRVRVVIPAAPQGVKMPVVISPNLAGWAGSLVRRGYISAGYAGNDFMDDAAPLKAAYPDYDFATLPRRAWLAQVVVDYLATLPEVDVQRIAINGYSRDGKMAMIAASLDTRIAAVMAGSTGVGGAVPWRFAGERYGGESVESTTRAFPDWFVPRLRFFSGREDYLPVDANLYLALIAPRAALLQWGFTDQVASGWGMEQAYESAMTVYDRMGQKSRLGLLAIAGFHGSNDVEASLDWLDIQLGRSAEKWSNRLVFGWSFPSWSKANAGKALAAVKSISAAQKIEAVQWALGEAPPMLKPLAGETMRFRRNAPSYGPVEIGKGNIGNPGQLAPDVHSWVIAGGGGSYGWRAPEKNNVSSRRIYFGGVAGDLYFPTGASKTTPLPTVIWLHGYHYPLGYSWVYRTDLHPILALTRAGYAVLAYDQSGFGMRWSEAEHFYNRFPQWSRMGKMVEDLRLAVDFLQTDSLIDVGKIWLYGYAMGGTLALHAAALDQRIAGVVSIAGFTPMRTDIPQRGTSAMTRYSHLYGLIPRLGLYAGREAELPYDFDDLISLIAPRPVLVVQPQRDRDASPDDVRAAVQRAQKTYQLRGAAKNLILQEPDDYARLTDATQDKAVLQMQQWIGN
jgi:dienelactone hydrolase